MGNNKIQKEFIGVGTRKILCSGEILRIQFRDIFMRSHDGAKKDCVRINFSCLVAERLTFS